jgi:hypothetical protein
MLMPPAVAALVHQPPELHHEVDHERAVACRDLTQVGGRLALDRLFASTEAAREAGELSAKGGSRENVLAHEARHLVARTA